MGTNKKLLYFSLNPLSTRAFLDYIDRTFQDRRNSFRICAIDEKKPFRHASELAMYLDQQQDLGYFYVIIDYLSFYNCHLDDYVDEEHHEREKKDEITITEKKKKKKTFSVSQASEIIAKTILQYPEVLFLFDESWQGKITDEEKNKEDIDFTDFIFYKGGDFGSSVFTKYHQYSVCNETPFAFIRRNWDNLYDGSNLRFAIKRYIYEHLKVKRYNFSAVQNSRSENLALCVEEEHAQNRFNSYALYANGFRVLPISSSQDLKDVNLSEISPSIVVRDYDLQFPDENTEIKDEKEIGGESRNINLVDFIRGAKFVSDLSENNLFNNRWYVLTSEDNKFNYWSSLLNHPVFFISKGGHGISIIGSARQYIKERKQLLVKQLKQLMKADEAVKGKKDIIEIIEKQTTEASQDKNNVFLNGTTEQIVRGIEKPVSGVYLPFHTFEEVKERFNSFGDSELVINNHILKMLKHCKDKKEKKQMKAYLRNEYKTYLDLHLIAALRNEYVMWRCPLSKSEEQVSIDKIIEADRQDKHQRWTITTERQNHNHGVPLDLYDLAKNMIARASDYYKREKFIKSAIVSSEVIEVLNGFHEALVLEAYHILAISENAIAMNTIGGNEEDLSLDANFRISKIASEVERLMDRAGNYRRKYRYNVLNQIFSDCRAFCKEKKHFESENRFISAIAHINEGYTYKDIILAIFEIGKMWYSNLLQFIYTLGHAEKS